MLFVIIGGKQHSEDGGNHPIPSHVENMDVFHIHDFIKYEKTQEALNAQPETWMYSSKMGEAASLEDLM